MTTPDGGTEIWNIELSRPNIIGRKSSNSESIQDGDKLRLTMHPMKYPRKFVLLGGASKPPRETFKDKN